jgi:hypothetical protein
MTDQNLGGNEAIPARVGLTDFVIFQKLNNEAVLLNLKTQNYYGLDDVGASMWNLLLEDGDVETAVEKLKLIYAADESVLRRDLHFLIRELLSLDLLRAVARDA